MLRVPETVERFRIRKGVMGSDPGDPFGAFQIEPKLLTIINRSGPADFTRMLDVIASNGQSSEERALGGWEHVSVKAVRYQNGPNNPRFYIPTWYEMVLVKELFWEPEDTVIQYHPKESEYVRNHEYVLHLWRPLDAEIPRPPSILVGYGAGEIKGLEVR